jgi:hypothetical protein
LQSGVALFLTVFIVAIAVGCSATAEQVVIGQFFAASRLLDRTSLQNFATVTFAPNEQGTISTFDIIGVTPEQRRPLATNLAVASERTIAELSVNGAGGPLLDVTRYAAELVSKDVTISAPVRRPAGPSVRKTLVITMQRAILRDENPVNGRWVVTGIRIAG